MIRDQNGLVVVRLLRVVDEPVRMIAIAEELFLREAAEDVGLGSVLTAPARKNALGIHFFELKAQFSIVFVR